MSSDIVNLLLSSLWPLHSPQWKNHFTPWKASLSRLLSHRFSWSPSSFTGSFSWVSTLGLTASTHSQNSPPIQFCSGLMSLFALAWYQDFEKLPPANGFQMFHLHLTHLPQAQIHMSDHILDVSLGCSTTSSNSIWPKPSSWLPSHQTSSSAVFNHFSFLTPHILSISKLCCLCLQSISKLTYFYLCYSHPGLRLGPSHLAYRNCFLLGLFDSIIAFHGPLILSPNFIEFYKYQSWIMTVKFSCSVVSDSLWPHGLQHTRLSCPSPTPRAYSIKLTSIKLVMPSNHLIVCRPLLLLPSIFPSIRAFSSESVLPPIKPFLCIYITETKSKLPGSSQNLDLTCLLPPSGLSLFSYAVTLKAVVSLSLQGSSSSTPDSFPPWDPGFSSSLPGVLCPASLPGLHLLFRIW